MARGHLFVIVVLLAAAAVAGLLAVTGTAQSKPAAATDPAITFRLKKLDRLEASLEQQLAGRRATARTAPVLVYRRAASPEASEPRDDGAGEGQGSERAGGRDD